ncbi:MAG: hypothetical protein WCT40_01305 [Candidatus Magasanikbacteria bacterium]|jgi:hypothetical protein
MIGQTRSSVIILAIIIFVLGLVLIVGGYGWFLKKQARVLVGTARPTFPYSDYSQADLNRLYPQEIDYSGVPDKQTPEQTHALFLSALKKGDFDAAVNCCFRAGDREKTKEFLNGVKQKGMLNLMISDITNIDPDFRSENKATYVYDGTWNGKKIANFMQFMKSLDGIWYIEKL